MNTTHWKPHGPYEGMYEKFYEASQEATGYDFGKGPPGNVPPPTVKRLNPLAWWSLDRPKRLVVIRRMRDRFLNDILRLRGGLEKSATSSPLEPVHSTECKQPRSGNKERVREKSEQLDALQRQFSRVA